MKNTARLPEMAALCGFGGHQCRRDDVYIVSTDVVGKWQPLFEIVWELLYLILIINAMNNVARFVSKPFSDTVVTRRVA